MSAATVADLARCYIDIGWHVFPVWSAHAGACQCGDSRCKNPGKHPVERLVPHGQDNATTDAVTVAQWFRAGDRNIAAATAPSGFITIDVDLPRPKNRNTDGRRALAEYEEEHGKLPETITGDTGSGGLHLNFVRPPGVQLVGKLGKAIDIKANGYIVLPPSAHASGGFYRWRASRGPGEIGLAELPPAWIELLRAPEPKSEPAVSSGAASGDDFFAALASLDQRYVLQCLSGSSIVDGERFAFKRTRSGKYNLLVDRGDGWEATSNFIDASGRIAARSSGRGADDGGPLASTWLRYYDRDDKTIYRGLIDAVPELAAFEKEREKRRRIRDERPTLGDDHPNAPTNGYAAPAHETRDRAPDPEPTEPMPDAPADSNAARSAPPPADQHDADSGDGAPNAPRERSYMPTHGGNAERFVDTFAPKFRYVAQWKRWVAYDGKRWDREGSKLLEREAAKEIVQQLYAEARGAVDQASKLDVQLREQHPDTFAAAASKGRKQAEIEARERARKSPEYQEAMQAQHDAGKLMEWAMKSHSPAGVDSMLDLARSDPRIAATPDHFDTDPMLINVKNGTLDLCTGQLRPHRPEDMITRMASVEYDPEASCEEWEKFLAKIMPDQETRDWLQRWFGYALTGSIMEQCLAFFIGGGSNGKSVYCGTVMGIMGDYARLAMPDLLVAKNNNEHPCEFADLAGRRYVVVSELDHNKKWAEGTIKRLTGEKRFSARGIGENPSNFVNSIKFNPMANFRLEIKETNHGTWRRFRVVPFSVKIPNAQQDKTLLDRFTGELAAGIFAWAVRGCADWQRDGLGTSKLIEAETAKYKTEQDLVGNWLADRCWCTCPQGQDWCSCDLDDDSCTSGRGHAKTRGSCGHCGCALQKPGPRDTDSKPWESSTDIQADFASWCGDLGYGKPWTWMSVRTELLTRDWITEKNTTLARGLLGIRLRNKRAIGQATSDRWTGS